VKFLLYKESFNATYAMLASNTPISNAERRRVHSSCYVEANQRRCPTPELTRRPHESSKVIAEINDERDAIGRSG
jgi:hypothetical protein